MSNSETSGPAALTSESRVFSLDVLRGCAIALVLCRHVPAKPIQGEAFTHLFNIGWTGVDLFFVLSGLLISRLLFREIQVSGTFRLGRFWLRRCYKIWPSYYLIFLPWSIAVTTYLYLAHKKPVPIGKISNLFFLQNYFPEEVRWPHSWSLAIEEHFYLLFPPLLLALLRLGRLRLFPSAALLSCLLVLLLRLVTVHENRTWADFYYPTHLRADGLIFGTFLGYMSVYHASTYERARAFRLPAMLLLVPVYVLGTYFPLTDNNPFTYTIYFSMLYLTYGLIVVSAMTGGVAINPPMVFAAWLGRYSYTIYLGHAVIGATPAARSMFHALAEQTISGVWTERCLFWAFSIAAGYAASRVIEQPFLRLRSRRVP